MVEFKTVTERDLLRQVAANLTKEQITFAKTDTFDEKVAKNGKAIMEQNLQKVRAVWQSLEKFLHKQIFLKNRSVDTGVFGIFKPCDSEAVLHLPPPELIEDGKLKL